MIKQMKNYGKNYKKRKSMMTYQLLTETIDIGGAARITYGIVAVTENGKTITSIRDISCNREKAQAFVDLCNTLGLSLLHIDDAVDDFLAEQ